jgi:hypothetical protein
MKNHDENIKSLLAKSIDQKIQDFKTRLENNSENLEIELLKCYLDACLNIELEDY